MNSLVRFTVMAGVGLGVAGARCVEPQKIACTPFPPPSITAGAACRALPPRTVLDRFGDLDPGGGFSPTSLTVDDNAVYFTASVPGTTAPSLYRMPKTGGPLQVLDEGVIAPIRVAGSSLVYTRLAPQPHASGLAYIYQSMIVLGGQCSVKSLPGIDGTSFVEFAPIVDAKGGVTWVAAPQPAGMVAVLHWDPSTDGVTEIASLPEDAARNLIGDADHIYWSDVSSTAPGGTTTIIALPSAGGTPTPVATLSSPSVAVGVDDDSFYARTGGGLARIEKVDGSMTIITTAGPSAIGYYFHDTNVYWADGATVVRVPKTGGSPEVVLNLGDPDSMVLGIGFDACNLYVGVETTDDAKYAIWGQGLSAPAFPSCGAPYAFLGDDDASTVDASVRAPQLSTVDASLVATQLERDLCSD